jgi:hypothetical protein
MRGHMPEFAVGICASTSVKAEPARPVNGGIEMGWSARRAKAIADPSRDIRFMDRVRILDGPWAGHVGIYIEDRPGMRGTRRVVRLDNDEEAFVTRSEQWERVPKKAA